MTTDNPMWIAATVMVARGYTNSKIEASTGLHRKFIRQIRVEAESNRIANEPEQGTRNK